MLRTSMMPIFINTNLLFKDKIITIFILTLNKLSINKAWWKEVLISKYNFIYFRPNKFKEFLTKNYFLVSKQYHFIPLLS
jgi:hypothetical protein